MGKTRRSWLDDEGGPGIEDRARQLTTFVETMADGVVDEKELAAQEKRVTDLMREIEPQLDDKLHEQVTRLLSELTAFDIMKLLHSLQSAKSKVRFRG